MTKRETIPSVAREWKEDDNTTDQSDQLMSRFSDILCFVLFSSSVPSFLLLGFWSERNLDLPQCIYTRLSLVPPLGLSLWCVYVSPPVPNLRVSSPYARAPVPRGRLHLHASQFNELFIYYQVDDNLPLSLSLPPFSLSRLVVRLARDMEENVSP